MSEKNAGIHLFLKVPLKTYNVAELYCWGNMQISQTCHLDSSVTRVQFRNYVTLSML